MKNKIIKTIFIIFMSMLLCLVACGEVEEPTPPCEHEPGEWEWQAGSLCNEKTNKYLYCTKCNEILDVEYDVTRPHEWVETEIPATCTESGKIIKECSKCGKTETKFINALGHDYVEVIDKAATSEECGYRHDECSRCGDKKESYAYSNNGYSAHGRVRVVGPDLVDKDGEKFQLIGMSTHGIQWFGNFVDYDIFKAVRDAFGINVFRISLYTSEGGYCVCNETKKEQLYQKVVDGINYATELDCYVIVDWHMLGADPNDIEDENPLHYKDQAVEFFDRITKEFKDADNILYEIMNEPSGSATWKDCKEYAELVIPVIRNNDSNAIVLVGNPQWTSDLESPRKDPPKDSKGRNFTNIMYAFHFYAADNVMTSKITNAYNAKMPVFVTEHGGMDSDGDGAVNVKNIEAWYKVLDSKNISYVAWNLSNTKGSSGVMKYQSSKVTDFSDDNLKEWGIYYKAHVRERFGLN